MENGLPLNLWHLLTTLIPFLNIYNLCVNTFSGWEKDVTLDLQYSIGARFYNQKKPTFSKGFADIKVV